MEDDIYPDHEPNERPVLPKKKHPPKKEEAKIDWGAQGALILGGTLFVMILLYAVLGSCRHQKSERRPMTEESVLPAVVQYGGEKLPGKTFVGMEATRTDKDPELIGEVKKIIDSGGMPAQVFQNDVPPEMNIATELSREFKIYQQNPGELEQLRNGVSRGGNWDIKEETLSALTDILERVESKRLDVREIILKKDVCFSFEFVQDPDFGEVPETEASDFMADYVLLEEYAIARSLQAGKIADATESLNFIFRMAQLASEVKNPEIRTKAANIRLNAISIMQTVVLHPKFEEKDLVELYKMLLEQLESWTPDAYAWIGDRASGMKVYNLIRQYGLEVALEPGEVDEMRHRGLFEDFNKNLLRNLAHDEVFYLKSMQRIIDACEEPFYRRLPLILEIDNQVRAVQGTSVETIIAEFLFRGIRNLMQLCAQDRTRCETAVLAMAISLQNSSRSIAPALVEKSLETLTVDPLYGKNYEIRQIRNDEDPRIDIVWVSFHQSWRPFIVPDYSKTGDH